VQRSTGQHLSLAFLAPNLVKAAVEGRLPRGIGVERLRDPPAEWRRQFETLGLNPECVKRSLPNRGASFDPTATFTAAQQFMHC
jgi:hypothetical protein